jgi:hypothetical protein
MQKIKNPAYMRGIAEDIGKKIAKNPEVIRTITDIVSDFCTYIDNFTLKFIGVTDVPEEIIGIIPSSDSVEKEYTETEEIPLGQSIFFHEKTKKLGINLDLIKQNATKMETSSSGINRAVEKEEEEEEEEEDYTLNLDDSDSDEEELKMDKEPLNLNEKDKKDE